MSGRDIERLAPYTSDPLNLQWALFKARITPIQTRLPAIISDRWPESQKLATRHANVHWEEMDEYGFLPYPVQRISPEHHRWLKEQMHTHRDSLNHLPISKLSDRAVKDLVLWCRERGVAIAAVWAPESPAYREMYEPQSRDACDAYSHCLSSELGIAVFPAPEHLPESDFVDGFHLTPDGAAKYSQWLADTHLRVWLSNVLK